VKKDSVSRTVALGGLLTALGWLFILLASVLPTGRIFLLSLSSFTVMVAWAELSPLRAIVVYAAISGLSSIYPGIFVSALFLCFFGSAPLISLVLHRLLPVPAASIARHAILTILIAAALFATGLDQTLQEFFSLEPALFWLAAVAVIQVFLFVYDYFLRGFASIWANRIRPGSSFI
jgi:hypothetical protein